MLAPRPSRPHMPDYDLVPASEGTLLEWSWAEERLRGSGNYWLATSRPDGRPHAAPVWGVWTEDGLLFSTDGVKARNLAARPDCVATTEGASEAVIVEGQAAPFTDRDALPRLLEAYALKYEFPMDPTRGNYWLLRPRVAFGFMEDAGQFQQTATRWTFRSA